jgi:hypothetical protein
MYYYTPELQVINFCSQIIANQPFKLLKPDDVRRVKQFLPPKRANVAARGRCQ